MNRSHKPSVPYIVMEASETWALLVSLTDIDTDPIPINKSKFVFGRAEDCDQSFPENKLVSLYHCYIEREKGSDEDVWLYDTSTNGTLFNMKSKITKGNRMKLMHGDEFYIVYKKDNEDVNVGFVFQSLCELEKEQEEEGTQEYSPHAMLDSTLLDDDCNLVEEATDCRQGAKRTSAESTPEEVSNKRLKVDEKVQDSSETTGQLVTACENLKEETEQSAPGQTEQSAPGQTEQSAPGQTETHAEVIAAAAAFVPQKELQEGDVREPEPTTCLRDNMEENLLCIICQEIMHDCISLQPCLHTFCAGCYSDWMKRSEDCPSCRKKVKRINKNHIVNNLIEAYLKERPEKKRPEEELRQLDKKNTITKDMLYHRRKCREMRQDDDEEEEEDDGEEEECVDSEDFSDTDEEEDWREDHNFRLPNAGPVVFQPAPAPLLLGFGTPFFGTTRPPKTVCRQCPEYKNIPDSGSGLITNPVTDEASSSTKGGGENVKRTEEKVMVDAPPYTCPLLQTHVLCQCCLQPMPDRRAEHAGNPDNIPAQQCTMCFRAYCHAYWGCRKADCLGCLAKFKDLNFGRKCLDYIVLDNPYESDILKKYLDNHDISVREMLARCLQKMQEGKYTCTDQARGVNPNSWLCYTCGLRNLKDLVYLYRRDIPQDHLTDDVTVRPDCHWGKNCRTQRNKLHHAANFNHICDQKRFIP